MMWNGWPESRLESGRWHWPTMEGFACRGDTQLVRSAHQLRPLFAIVRVEAEMAVVTCFVAAVILAGPVSAELDEAKKAWQQIRDQRPACINIKYDAQWHPIQRA